MKYVKIKMILIVEFIWNKNRKKNNYYFFIKKNDEFFVKKNLNIF